MSVRQPSLRGKLFKRARQVVYLIAHPIDHWRSAQRLRASGSSEARAAQYKYLGGYLALPMAVVDRRWALVSHYEMFDRLASENMKSGLGDSVLLWQRHVADDKPPLRIMLEAARLAPMEGELQLRFAFRSDLFVLTFLLSSGRPFNIDASTVLFVGGAQGGYHCREETREASKLNGEISPAAMLVIAVQVLAKMMRIERLIAVNEDHQVSTSYASELIKLDYRRFWADAGGIRHDRYYQLPQESTSKPLEEVPQTHRKRTRRKREAKAAIRAQIEQRLAQLMAPQTTALEICPGVSA